MKPYKTIDSDNSMNDKVEIIILGRMGSGNHDRENATGMISSGFFKYLVLEKRPSPPNMKEKNN